MFQFFRMSRMSAISLIMLKYLIDNFNQITLSNEANKWTTLFFPIFCLDLLTNCLVVWL